MAGFPNLFMLVGPNTGLGHSSLVFMIESQVAYTIDALRYLRRTGAAAVEVRPQAQAAYNETVQNWMDGTVWTTGGCSSWYLDAQGRNTTLWPTFTWRFRRATRRFQPAEYLTHAQVASQWYPTGSHAPAARTAGASAHHVDMVVGTPVKSRELRGGPGAAVRRPDATG